MSKGTVFKNGRVYWIQYYAAGRRYRENSETANKEQAQALLRKRLQEIWEGTFFPETRQRKELTLGDLLEFWLTERSSKKSIGDDKRRLGVFVDRFGAQRMLSTITADDIATWRKELGVDLSVATVNRHLATVKAALNLAEERGHKHRNPMRGNRLARENNARNRVCSPEEYVRLRDAANPELRFAIVLANWTGMRLGEIVKLRRDRIDKQQGMLRLTADQTKEVATKTVPLPKEVLDELDALPVRLDGLLVGTTSGNFSHMFGRLCEELQIDDLHFHDLRHTALSRMADAGVDIMTMAAISGHKTLAMLKRYVHRSPQALRDAMAKVEAHAAR